MKTDSIVCLVKHVDQKQSSGTKRDRISDQVRPCKGMVVTNLELSSVGLVRKMGMCRVSGHRQIYRVFLCVPNRQTIHY